MAGTLKLVYYQAGGGIRAAIELAATMVNQDLKDLYWLPCDVVESSRMCVRRDIETAIGVRHGNLERLLNETLELRGSVT